MEMRLYIAKLFWHFDLIWEPESRRWVAGDDSVAKFTMKKAPLMVTLKPATNNLTSSA